MAFISEGIGDGLRILFSFDPEFLQIVWVSLLVSGSAVVLAALTGVPLGILVSQSAFRGKRTMSAVLQALMSVPTVVIGLTVYAILSREGPLGGLNLLYTRPAMVIGQWLLALPITAALTMTYMDGLDKRIVRTIESLGADRRQCLFLLVREARFGIMGGVMAAFARVFAEIGIAMMLGGNIRGATRNITTAIALETGKGDFSMAVALGLVLVLIAFVITFTMSRFHRPGKP